MSRRYNAYLRCIVIDNTIYIYISLTSYFLKNIACDFTIQDMTVTLTSQCFEMNDYNGLSMTVHYVRYLEQRKTGRLQQCFCNLF